MRKPTRSLTVVAIPFLAGVLSLAQSHCTITADGGDVASGAEPLRGAGQMCGGVAALPCDDGLDCFYAPGSCGKGDQAGTCGSRPEICTFIYQPVCGCDGRTYANRCEAERSGMSIARGGSCEKGEGEPADAGRPRGGL